MLYLTTIFRIALASLALFLFTGTTKAQGGTLVDRDINVNGVARDYLMYLPAGYSGLINLPVLFVYHGGAGDARGMLQLADFRLMADSERFIPVYPNGLRDSNGDRIWNSEGPYSNGVDELGFTAAMIDAMDLDYAINTNRIYACGYSNGANMSWELAGMLSNRIAAVGTVAGSMWTWTKGLSFPTRPVPVVSIHGTRDFYNPWSGSSYSLGLIEASEFFVENNNGDLMPDIVDLPDTAPNDGSTVTQYTWVNGDKCVEVEHYKVNGGDHDWPGVWGNMDIDSNEIIWSFVSQYSLNGKIDCNGLTLSTPGAVVAGNNSDFNVTSATPSSPTFLAYGLSVGSTSVPQLGITLDLNRAKQLGRVVRSDTQGNASWTIPVPWIAHGLTAYLQACQLGLTSNVLTVSIQ